MEMKVGTLRRPRVAFACFGPTDAENQALIAAGEATDKMLDRRCPT
jgi:hypothetical protein